MMIDLGKILVVAGELGEVGDLPAGFIGIVGGHLDRERLPFFERQRLGGYTDFRESRFVGNAPGGPFRDPLTECFVEFRIFLETLLALVGNGVRCF